MDIERYKEIQNMQSGLTKKEIKEGWHFCLEWDDMLVHPEWEEAKICGCEVRCCVGDGKIRELKDGKR